MNESWSTEFPAIPNFVNHNGNNFSGNYIYLLLLISAIGGLCALPLVEIDIYQTTRGMIRPSTERQSLTMINSGKILLSRISDNLFVHKGDTLLTLDNNGIDEQLALLQTRLTKSEALLSDVSQLCDQPNPYKTATLLTSQYFNEKKQFLMELDGHEITRLQLKNELSRKQKLYQKGVISRVELEVSSFNFKVKQSQIQLFKDTWKARWESESRELENTCLELRLQKDELYTKWSAYVMIAPISGSLLNTRDLAVGNFVLAGTSIAEISPERDLIIDCYIDPMSVGLINKSLDVNFKIDAFDYNYWGVITGKILEISNDVEYNNSRPVYKVRCSLDQDYLRLKNGHRGRLKKGMTLTAQFKLTKRSLWNLLYDKADDWLNPNENISFRQEI